MKNNELFWIISKKDGTITKVEKNSKEWSWLEAVRVYNDVLWYLFQPVQTAVCGRVSKQFLRMLFRLKFHAKAKYDRCDKDRPDDQA